MSGRRSGLWFVVPLVALWAIPVVIFAVLVPASQSIEANALSSTPPSLVTVGTRVDAAKQAVDVTISTSPAPTVRSAISGLVTGTNVSTGSAVTNGLVLITVDGIAIRAYIEPAPLFRDLQAGSHGADVQQLSSFLNALGFLPASAVSSVFGKAMSAAASSYSKSIGAPPDGSFHASSVSWIPPGALSVGELKTQPGDTIGAGDVIFGSTSNPTAVTFAVAGSDNRKPQIPQVRLQLEAGNERVTFNSLTPSASERSDVSKFLIAATAAGSATASVNGSKTIYSGAILSVASPKRVGVIPSSAVYVATSRAACLFLQNSAKYEAFKLINPQLISGELGSVAVTPALAGSRVVRNPSSLTSAVRARCG